MSNDILADLAYLYGQPTVKAKFKEKPEHFIVKENLGFSPDGDGEHLFVRIRKTGENTRFVANELAKACGVKSKDVSWAGLKDRHAITEQWLSVCLPKQDNPDFSSFLSQYPQIEILDISRHRKKLRPGELKENHFQITLTSVSDMGDVLRRLEYIQRDGVPNYFGTQRFGHDGNNVREARRWGRDNVRTRNQSQRSLYLSAARSWIFNHIVSERIQQGLFDQLICGDIALVQGEFVLVTEDNLVALNQTLSEGLSHISGALAGDNELPTVGKVSDLEQGCLDAEPDLMKLIRGNRMQHDRRKLSLKPNQLNWKVKENEVILDFSLDAGCFATSVLRELIEFIPVERVFE
ncbi:tRNA pseudouridine synthase D [Vibrio aerogenes CECT 7868]|uniref:tRNA pseudouridine synthase D n=1 Tax=Vibrio aerogenes CECT 7868 TaxID=1216006 RepID=A0A1M5YEF4_9VIBR|nr:tRNA pseudouridine(13) synthase TruD [Vibrio aerogenes]SHI10407.1 tRNA pseudouridine synthase D [Vibrio aerogenes CECT 7868]